ncbi:MAG: hypothetical protein KJN66_00530 [Bacteroidia bacterium]|nr:hypothetical protein [Bacteroidia bacterium]
MKFIILLIFIPLLGFPQLDFKSSIGSNRITDGDVINDTARKHHFHYDVFIGTFIPTQNAKLIGVKPIFGASFGISTGITTYDLTGEIRVGKTKNSYQLANSDMTDHYSGAYFGIDIVRGIWTNKKNKILLFGGAGLDLFEIEPAEYRNPKFLEYIFFGDEEIKKKDSRNISSLNLNFGLICRFYNKKKNYYAVRYRYNVVDYNSNKILTNVTGNFHSITLSFGGFSKLKKN